MPYCIESAKPNRIRFELLRVMQSKYKIDTFQETYFVIDSFHELFDATAPDFTRYYAELKQRPDIAANVTISDDKLINI